MAGLKELRLRISSIASTQKITSAMKMVAAARLRKSQDMLQKSQAYHTDFTTIIGRLVKEMKQDEKDGKVVYLRPQIMLPKSEENIILLVVFSSDKGLCGNYNANVLKECVTRINTLKKEGKTVKVLSLGKKAGEGIKRRFDDVEVDIIDDFAAKGPDYDETGDVVKRLTDGYGRDFDVCEIVYTFFNSAIDRQIKCERFLPLDIEVDDADERFDNKASNAFYEYDGSKQGILMDLVPLYAGNLMFQKLLNSQTSEHGARMTSMDNATRNAKDMINKLTLKYNRLRQSAITTELIEIISGAEAL